MQQETRNNQEDNMEELIKKITAVINTLNAATLRADQIDAVQRISICTAELNDVIREMREESGKEDKT